MVKMVCNVVEIAATVAFGVSQLITDFIRRFAKPFGLNGGQLPVHGDLRGGMWHVVDTFAVGMARAALQIFSPDPAVTCVNIHAMRTGVAVTWA